MYVTHELGQARIAVDQPGSEFARVTCRVADALNAVNVVDILEQRRKIDNVALRREAAVSVHVLTEKRHFLDTLVGKLRDFDEYVNKRTRDFFPARIGHDAIRAVLGASLHDRDESTRPMRVRRRQVVELFDFGEAYVNLRLALLRTRFKKLRQAM